MLAAEEVEQAKKIGVLERKFQLMIREVLWQLVLLAMMLWVIVGNLDRNVFHQSQHLRNLFVEEMPTVWMPGYWRHKLTQTRVGLQIPRSES